MTSVTTGEWSETNQLKCRLELQENFLKRTTIWKTFFARLRWRTYFLHFDLKTNWEEVITPSCEFYTINVYGIKMCSFSMQFCFNCRDKIRLLNAVKQELESYCLKIWTPNSYQIRSYVQIATEQLIKRFPNTWNSAFSAPKRSFVLNGDTVLY